jgi:hypothetical protein
LGPDGIVIRLIAWRAVQCKGDFRRRARLLRLGDAMPAGGKFYRASR